MWVLFIAQMCLSLGYINKANDMKNLINTISEELKKEVKGFGVTEIFVIDGECHVTSNFNMPFELIEKIESEIL